MKKLFRKTFREMSKLAAAGGGAREARRLMVFFTCNVNTEMTLNTFNAIRTHVLLSSLDGPFLLLCPDAFLWLIPLSGQGF